MRKNNFLILCLTIVIIIGCDNVSYTYETNVDYEAPNWTSDGKVVFIKDSNYVKIAHGAMGSEQWNVEGSKEVLTLCEINSDGTGFTEKGVMLRSEDYAYALEVTGLSSAGDWVAFGIEGLHIYVANRNATNIEEVEEGTYPDFSPDAAKIVYEKPDNGIWIMDRDGGNDHPIWQDSLNKVPSWSSDGDRIAFVRYEGWQDEDLWVMDVGGGNREKILDGTRAHQSDWAPVDSNAIVCSVSGRTRVIYLDTISMRELEGAYTLKWSPDGACFTGTDENGIFVMEVDSSNKILIQP